MKKESKLDAKTIKPIGEPMPKTELESLATIETQEVSFALDFFSKSVPKRYSNLLD